MTAMRPDHATTRLRATMCLAALLVTVAYVAAAPVTVTPELAAGHEGNWRMPRGEWSLADGVLEQKSLEGGSVAVLKEPAFSDFVLSLELNIKPEGPGVRAAAIAFRAMGTMTYYWVHLDSKNDNVILVRSTPENTWDEITRRRCDIADGKWHRAEVECKGSGIRIFLDDKEVLAATDDAIPAGRIALGTSQGHVLYRNIKIEGEVHEMAEPLRDEEPPPPLYQIISRGEAAGPYQAFPDACRLDNGDILCVFYAGYGHVSLPNEEWPKGGRVCMVRSSDEGRTWTEPAVLYDDDHDNRDPHIAQLSDGTLVCSLFSLYMDGGTRRGTGSQLLFSHDGGKTWEDKARSVSPGYYCSAPVRELPDGTLLLGVYSEGGGVAWGGVIRSTDKGKTWSAPIDIGKEVGAYLDAETDVIQLKDGTLYAALRSSKVNMHYATSNDLGVTWSPAKDIGFKGHAPHFTRLTTGEILLTHRVPATSLHVSRDECKTWQGPYELDRVGGAYPATVELKDGTVLAIYYTEGAGSHVRALRFRLTDEGIEKLALD